MDLFENHIAAEDKLLDFSKLSEDGTWVYGFGCYGSIDGYVENKHDEDEDADFDKMIGEIQKLLPDGECFVLVQSGHENLRFVDGGAVYVTNEVIRYHGLMDWIAQQAKECGTDNWTPTY
jgi:hypothetical protein